MEMSLFDALAMVSLGIGEAEQALLEKRAGRISCQHEMPLSKFHLLRENRQVPTLFRSRRQMRCSAGRECRIHQQCRLRPIGKLEIVRDRGGNLNRTAGQLRPGQNSSLISISPPRGARPPGFRDRDLGAS